MNLRGFRFVSLAAATAAAPLLVAVSSASAQNIDIYGGLTYDETTGSGFKDATFTNATGTAVNSLGQGIGFADLYPSAAPPENREKRATRFSAGGSAIQLTGLTTDPSVIARSGAYSINSAGLVVGFANTNVGGVNLGDRAVRWDAAGNVFELAHLGVNGSGATNTYAYGLNSSLAVGIADKYVGGNLVGKRPVRWDISTGAVTELGNIADNSGFDGVAYAINESSVATGQISKYDGNQYKGERAVRWNADGTALELDNLGLSNQQTYLFAYAINSAGQIAGYADKYSSGDKGDRAVRWDAATGAATELSNLGLSGAGTTFAYAFAINEASQVAGRSFKYVGGVSQGERAVRWNADNTYLELADLGLSATGTTSASAFSINASGQTAGRSNKYVGGVDLGDRAVYWSAAGAITDLNTLVDPAANWVLTRARSISDNGWIAGFGQFDPDGADGPLTAYQRHFLLNVATENAWQTAAGGSWQTGGNWFTNFAPGLAVDALFNLNATYTVTLAGPGTAKNLVARGGAVSLDLAGNTINANSLVVGRDAGDSANLTLNGGGTVTLSSGLTVAANPGAAGTFTLAGGTLNAPSIVVNDGGTFVHGGGVINTNGVQLSGNALMRLSPGQNKTLKVATLAVGAGSKLDLTDNRLVVTTPLATGTWGGTAYTDVAGLVDAGRGNASNAQWDGAGIVTSDTRAVNNNDLVSIGVARVGDVRNIADSATTTFGGQTVLGSDTIAMVTWGGDANLDGKINIDDYGQIDFNVSSSGSVFGWFNGDFNYDGKINIDDYGIIDFNVSAQNSIFPTTDAAPGGLEGVQAVPEPTAGLLALACGAIAMRRVRRR